MLARAFGRFDEIFTTRVTRGTQRAQPQLVTIHTRRSRDVQQPVHVGIGQFDERARRDRNVERRPPLVREQSRSFAARDGRNDGIARAEAATVRIAAEKRQSHDERARIGREDHALAQELRGAVHGGGRGLVVLREAADRGGVRAVHEIRRHVDEAHAALARHPSEHRRYIRIERLSALDVPFAVRDSRESGAIHEHGRNAPAQEALARRRVRDVERDERAALVGEQRRRSSRDREDVEPFRDRRMHDVDAEEACGTEHAQHSRHDRNLPLDAGRVEARSSTAPMSARKVLVIANPIAGRGRGERAATELAGALRDSGIESEIFATRARGDARARAAAVERDVEAVVSIGGDGTLNEVFSGLTRRTIPVAQLALGTANVLARDLGLPRDPAALARIVAARKTRKIDVAHVGERLSFLGASAGYDAAVVHGLERIRRGPITRWTWTRAAVAEFQDYVPPELSVEIDGQLVDGMFGMILVANVVHYAGWPSLASDRMLDDGRFEAYLFPARTRIELLRHAARGLRARFPGGNVRRVQGRRFRVASARPVPVQIDGDAAGHTPFELRVDAEPRLVLVP